MKNTRLFGGRLTAISVVLAGLVLALGVFAGDAALRGIPVVQAVGTLNTVVFTAGDGPVSGTWTNDTGGPCQAGNPPSSRWYIGVNWDAGADADPTDTDAQEVLQALACDPAEGTATRSFGPIARDPADTLDEPCVTLYHAPSGNVQGADVDATTCFEEPPPPPGTGTITIQKICDPTDDPGLFNFLINDQVEATDVECGATTTAITLDVGSYTLSEEGGTGTDLSDYTVVIGGDCLANGSFTIEAEDALNCTITNTAIDEEPPPDDEEPPVDDEEPEEEENDDPGTPQATDDQFPHPGGIFIPPAPVAQVAGVQQAAPAPVVARLPATGSGPIDGSADGTFRLAGLALALFGLGGLALVIARREA